MARRRVEAFNERFRPDHGSGGPYPGWARKDTLRLFDCEPALFTDFMSSQARSSYEAGLIRFLGPDTEPQIFGWNGPDGWRSCWPGLDASLAVFAYDWMGRLYGLDSARVIQREPLVGRLDPGEGRVRQSDLTFAEFILGDLIAYGDQLLDMARFAAWTAAGGRALHGSDVAGYVAPLFNAGTDALSNMEVVDVARYVEKTGLAYAARRGLFRVNGATAVSGGRRRIRPIGIP